MSSLSLRTCWEVQLGRTKRTVCFTTHQRNQVLQVAQYLTRTGRLLPFTTGVTAREATISALPLMLLSWMQGVGWKGGRYRTTWQPQFVLRPEPDKDRSLRTTRNTFLSSSATATPILSLRTACTTRSTPEGSGLGLTLNKCVPATTSTRRSRKASSTGTKYCCVLLRRH